MSPAVALAALAGTAVAGAIADVAAVRAAARPERSGVAPRRRLLATLVRIGHRVGAPPPPADLRTRLLAAGEPLGLSVADVAAVKAGSAVAALLAGAPLAAALPGRLPLLALCALPLGGFLLPDMLLRRRARARGRAMELELPDVLDLLRVAVESGLPLERALGEVGRRDRGLLATELRATAGALALGIAREQALTDLGRRCPAPGMTPLVAALDRSGRIGAPLGGALAAQARAARATRARRLRDDAARAAPKIQLVVALLLVPSALLLVAAALVAGFA